MIALALASCLSLPHYSYTAKSPNITQEIINVQIDKTFNMDDKLAIDDALAAWNYALNGLIEFRVVSDAFDMEPSQINNEDLLFLRINSSSTFIPGSTTLAFTNFIGGREIFIISDRLKDRSLKGIAMHEIGHALGGRHTLDERHLMSIHYDAAWMQCIDEQAIQSVAAYQHLDADRMNFCIYQSITPSKL